MSLISTLPAVYIGVQFSVLSIHVLVVRCLEDCRHLDSANVLTDSPTQKSQRRQQAGWFRSGSVSHLNKHSAEDGGELIVEEKGKLCGRRDTFTEVSWCIWCVSDRPRRISVGAQHYCVLDMTEILRLRSPQMFALKPQHNVVPLHAGLVLHRGKKAPWIRYRFRNRHLCVYSG